MSHTEQLDGNAAYDLFEKSSYGKGRLAVLTSSGDISYTTTAYYTLAQATDVEKIYLLVRQAPTLPELLQEGKLVLSVDTGKGEAAKVVAQGTGVIVEDPTLQRELLRDYVQAIADEDVQSLSSEKDLPSDTYIVKLTPSLLKFRKDTTDQPELTAVFEAIDQ